MRPKKFVAKPVYLLPVAASLFIGILFTSLVLESQIERPNITVFPEVGFGPFVNALLFVAIAGFGATMIYLLLKYKVEQVVHLIFFLSTTVVTFTLSLLYLDMLLAVLNVNVNPLLLVFFSAVLTILVDLEVFILEGSAQNLIGLILGGATGAFLGAFIPMLSGVFILILLAVYDVVAVYRGPIGKIVSGGFDRLKGASISFMNVQIGLGDLTFYSMLVSHALLNFGWEACVTATFGVLVGSYLALKMLEKKGMFPGLPFSVALGLLAVYISTFFL